VSSYRDLLRSLVARAAGVAGGGLGKLGAVGRVKEALAQIRTRHTRIEDSAIGAAVARTSGVVQSMVQCDRGAIRIDASFADGESFVASVVPRGVYFAPRGAKEVSFRIEPPEAGRHRHAADVVAAVAGAIARGLYGPLLGKDGAVPEAAGFVDREGDDGFRADLRTVPAVRKLAGKGPLSIVVDVLEVSAITVEPGAVRVEIKLPDVLGRPPG
jgi:hypothetical protein